MKRKITFQTALAALLAAMVLLSGAAFLVTDKRSYSENENRYLASFPKLSWESVKSGEYTEDLNTYLSDHFPLRDLFMGLKSGTEIALGRREINGVYIGRDGSFIENYKQPLNTEKVAKILKKFADLVSEQNAGIHLMLVPTAVSVLDDRLPLFAIPGPQEETMNELYDLTGIAPVRTESYLRARRDEVPLYYRTDHHWTSYGAYEGYRAYCEAAGLTPTPFEEFESETVTDEFYGTLYSKVNDYSVSGDSITVCTDPEQELTVYYADTEETTDSLYNFDYLEKKDKYSLFLNNLHPLIEITNAAAESDRELVLIKDSYANSMVPFLTRHFRRIYVFDTRSYKRGPSAFIKEHPQVTDILLLYNMNTLDTDLGIRSLY